VALVLGPVVYLAFAYFNSVARQPAGRDYLSLAGPGFRDFTRIAASSPEMWRDICLLNGKNIVEMIEQYQFSLNKIKKAVKHRDGRRLERLFRTASDIRRGMQ